MTHEYPERHNDGMRLPDDWDAELAELLGSKLDPDTEFWIEESRKKVLEATRQHIVAQYLEFCNNGLDIGAYATVLAHEGGIDTDTDEDFRPQFYDELDLIITTIDESQVGKVSVNELIRRKYRLAAELVARYGSMAARPLIDMIDIANPGGDMVSEFDADTIVATDELFTGSNAIRDKQYKDIWSPLIPQLYEKVSDRLVQIVGHRDDIMTLVQAVTASGIALATRQWEVNNLEEISAELSQKKLAICVGQIGDALEEILDTLDIDASSDNETVSQDIALLLHEVARAVLAVLDAAHDQGEL